MDTFPHLTVLSAGYQTEGHGQFDRIWESENIKMCYVQFCQRHIYTSFG